MKKCRKKCNINASFYA